MVPVCGVRTGAVTGNPSGYGHGMADTARPCPECGGSGRLGGCQDLFHALLALDHERRQPWGSHHALNVACFTLQHPGRVATGVLEGERRLIATFLDGGLDAVHELTAQLVRANRRGHRPAASAMPSVGPTPRESRGAARPMTIEDVAVDGTFPADGYPERMHAWASWIAGAPGAGRTNELGTA